MSAYNPGFDQTRPSAQYRTGNYNAHPPKVTSPPDGDEQWYLDGKTSNRMTLALLSGIPREVNWALSRLINLSDQHTGRFVLSTVPRLTETMLLMPDAYMAKYTVSKEAVATFVTPAFIERRRKYAVETMLILRNASFNDLNAAFLATHSQTLSTINDILRLPPDEVNSEMIIYTMDLLHIIGPLMQCPSKDKHPYGKIPIRNLETFVSTSNDRALILPTITLLTQLMTPAPGVSPDSKNYYLPPYTPAAESPVLHRILQFLAVVQDTTLLVSCLEFFSAYLSSLSASQAFLLRPELTPTLRLLVGVLRHERRIEIQTVKIGPSIKTAEAEDEWQPYELTDDELAHIAPMPEPERSFQWMHKMFEDSPGAEQTQVTFWTLYKDTFSPFTEHPMLTAADIIRNVTIEFPEASAASVAGEGEGSPARFVIQNIRRRLRPPSPFRFRCQWNTGTCAIKPPNSPEELFAHILSVHLAQGVGKAKNGDDSMSASGSSDLTPPPALPPTQCGWSTCSHQVASAHALRQHVLTHVPSTTPAPKNACQPSAFTLPSVEPANTAGNNANTSTAAALITPISRPPPPPPLSVVSFRGAPDPAKEPSTPSALLALYSLRMLFYAAFAETSTGGAAASMLNDENRFGFPSLPEIERDVAKEKSERGGAKGEVLREAEDKGRQAFKAIQSSLAEVVVGDPEMQWWILDMVHRADEEVEIDVEIQDSQLPQVVVEMQS